MVKTTVFLVAPNLGQCHKVRWAGEIRRAAVSTRWDGYQERMLYCMQARAGSQQPVWQNLVGREDVPKDSTQGVGPAGRLPDKRIISSVHVEPAPYVLVSSLPYAHA